MPPAAGTLPRSVLRVRRPLGGELPSIGKVLGYERPHAHGASHAPSMLRRRYASPRPRRARCPRSSPRARQHTCGRGERRRRGEHIHAEHWTQSSAAYLLISSVRRLRLRYARMARLMAMIAPRATSPILRFRAASRASCACVAAVTAQRFAEVACSMAAIRGHQRSSEVIRGHRRSSEEAIRRQLTRLACSMAA